MMLSRSRHSRAVSCAALSGSKQLPFLYILTVQLYQENCGAATVKISEKSAEKRSALFENSQNFRFLEEKTENEGKQVDYTFNNEEDAGTGPGSSGCGEGVQENHNTEDDGQNRTDNNQPGAVDAEIFENQIVADLVDTGNNHDDTVNHHQNREKADDLCAEESTEHTDDQVKDTAP